MTPAMCERNEQEGHCTTGLSPTAFMEITPIQD